MAESASSGGWLLIKAKSAKVSGSNAHVTFDFSFGPILLSFKSLDLLSHHTWCTPNKLTIFSSSLSKHTTPVTHVPGTPTYFTKLSIAKWTAHYHVL